MGSTEELRDLSKYFFYILCFVYFKISCFKFLHNKKTSHSNNKENMYSCILPCDHCPRFLNLKEIKKGDYISFLFLALTETLTLWSPILTLRGSSYHYLTLT